MKIDRTSVESKSSTAMAVPWKTIFSLPATVEVGTRLSARVYGYPTATAAFNCPQTLENTLSGISGGRVPFEDYELTKLAWEANPLSPIIGRCLESGRHAMLKWLSLLVKVLGGVTLRFTKMKSIAAAVAQTKNPLAEFNRSAFLPLALINASSKAMTRFRRVALTGLPSQRANDGLTPRHRYI